MKYKFYKRDGHWYIDLPDYIASGGTEADCEMVAGADNMLDLLSGELDSPSKEEIELDISVEETPDSDAILMYRDEDPYFGGANYWVVMIHHHNFSVWLCDITKFLYGEFPKTIYIKK